MVRSKVPVSKADFLGPVAASSHQRGSGGACSFQELLLWGPNREGRERLKQWNPLHWVSEAHSLQKGLTGRVETPHYGSASLVINVKWDWLTQRCCTALKAKYTLRILLHMNQCGLPKGDLLGYDADAKAWKVMRDKVWALIQATQIIKQPSISPSLGVTENESPLGVCGIQNMVKALLKELAYGVRSVITHWVIPSSLPGPPSLIWNGGSYLDILWTHKPQCKMLWKAQGSSPWSATKTIPYLFWAIEISQTHLSFEKRNTPTTGIGSSWCLIYNSFGDVLPTPQF